jgi:predicted nucleotidyltransferase
MGLKLGLEDMLGLSVDLIEPDAVTNPHFMSVAGKYRQPVYAA